MRSRGRRGRGMGNARRGRGAVRNVNARRPFVVGKRPGRRQLPDVWDKGSLLERGNSVLSNATKDVVISSNRLLVTNLNFSVTDDDIKELFSTCGKLKKAVINYDNTGHSNGTAEVVFFERAFAQKAFNSFNGVCLDQRPLKIQYLDAPDAAKTVVSRLTIPPGRAPRASGFSRGNLRNNRRTGAAPNSARGRGRGRGGSARGRKTAKSPAALDQEMLDYQNNEVEMK